MNGTSGFQARRPSSPHHRLTSYRSNGIYSEQFSGTFSTCKFALKEIATDGAQVRVTNPFPFLLPQSTPTVMRKRAERT